MSTLPNELTSRLIRRDAPVPPVQVVRATDPCAVIEAAVILGEQRAWLESLLGGSMDTIHPPSREEYAHPEAYYREPHAALFVGRIGGLPAGVVAACRVDDHTVELRRLYVRLSARGTGLGRRLSFAVIGFARRVGADRVFLETSTVLMPDAVRLYRSLGFADAPPLGYGDVPGIVGMELALGG